MLIASSRHTEEDLSAWRLFADGAMAHSQTKRFRERVRRASEALTSFVGSGRCYAGVSWGKDSTALAHLVATTAPDVPLVWVRVEPDFNPDCLLVRNAFRATHSRFTYDEIVVARSGEYRAHGTLDAGMRVAARRYGARYLSGVRGEESGVRLRRMQTWSESSPNACAPIGWWNSLDVFAYLVSRYLPIHPAYACTMGWLLRHGDIRVSPLGGARGSRPGDGWGRAEWEERYYGEELRALRAND